MFILFCQIDYVTFGHKMSIKWPRPFYAIIVIVMLSILYVHVRNNYVKYFSTVRRNRWSGQIVGNKKPTNNKVGRFSDFISIGQRFTIFF